MMKLSTLTWRPNGPLSCVQELKNAIILNERDITSGVFFAAIFHRVCMACIGESYGLLTSRAARTTVCAKFNISVKK